MNSDIKKMAKEIVRIKNDTNRAKPKPYDTSGVVRRVDGKTAYILFDGAEDETPVDMTINCKPGDNVKVRISNRRAWVTGNATAPPTDDKQAYVAQAQAVQAENKAAVAETEAKVAQETANIAEKEATNAASTAETARQISYDTAQYFWNKSEGGTGDIPTGAYITEIPKDDFTNSDPLNPYYCTNGNLLMRSNGVYLREGPTIISEFTSDNISFNLPNYGNVFKTKTVSPYLSSLSFLFGTDKKSGSFSLPYGYTYSSIVVYVAPYYPIISSSNYTVSTSTVSNITTITVSMNNDYTGDNPGCCVINAYTPPGAYTQIGFKPSYPEQHAFTIGNGNDNYNSNAFYINLNGDVFAKGQLTIENHDSPVGTVLKSEKTKTTGGSWTNSGAGLRLGKGSWIAFSKMFSKAPSGSSGRIGVRISVMDDNMENLVSLDRSQIIISATYNGSVETVIPIVSTDINYTIYTEGYQSTGSNLSCDYILSAIRIA